MSSSRFTTWETKHFRDRSLGDKLLYLAYAGASIILALAFVGFVLFVCYRLLVRFDELVVWVLGHQLGRIVIYLTIVALFFVWRRNSNDSAEPPELDDSNIPRNPNPGNLGPQRAEAQAEPEEVLVDADATFRFDQDRRVD